MSSKNKIHFRLLNTKNDYTDYRTGDYEVSTNKEGIWIYEVIGKNNTIESDMVYVGVCDKTGKKLYFLNVEDKINIKKSNKLNKKLYSDYLFEEGGYIVIRK